MKISTVLIILCMLLTACYREDNGFDASGIFEGDEVIVSAEANGKILDWQIAEGASVNAGQRVGRLDCSQLDLQQQQAIASLAALSQKQNDAAPQQEITQEQIRVQEKQISTIQEQISVSEIEKQRLEKLVLAEAAPAKQLDDLNGQLRVLNRQLETAKSQLIVLQKQWKSQGSAVQIQNRGIMSEQDPLQKRIDLLNDQIGRCQIINPIKGTVLTTYVNANEIAGMGKPLYKIANLDTLFLRAYMNGSDLSGLKIGQSVRVFVDEGAEKYRELPGIVTWISDKAEFTPKTIQTKEERSNLVYAIKVKVANDGYLKMGMYGEVKFR